MNRQRLELAIQVLKEVAAGTWKPVNRMYDAEEAVQFNLNTWFGFGADAKGSVSSCGYAACAIGHMCLDHRFIARGLVMPSRDWRPHLLLTKPSEEDPEPDNPDGWDAVDIFFELTRPQSLYLFSPLHYPTGRPSPAEVVEHINQLLDDPEVAH